MKDAKSKALHKKIRYVGHRNPDPNQQNEMGTHRIVSRPRHKNIGEKIWGFIKK